MVAPLAAAEAARDYGVDLRPYPYDSRPWQTFTTSGDWNPIGVLHHHTTGSKDLLVPDSRAQESMLRLLRNGYSGLSGPLCHFAPTYMGRGKVVAYAIGWGNVNDAGLLAPNVVSLVRAQKYRGERPDADSTVDGNPLFYGLEYLHPGDATAWPDELLDAGHRIAAALCELHDWPASVNVEHHEATTRKIDRSWTGNVRTAVAQVLQETSMPTPQEFANALLNTIVNPQAPAAEQVNVRTVLRTVVRQSDQATQTENLRQSIEMAVSNIVRRADISDMARRGDLLALPKPLTKEATWALLMDAIEEQPPAITRAFLEAKMAELLAVALGAQATAVTEADVRRVLTEVLGPTTRDVVTEVMDVKLEEGIKTEIVAGDLRDVVMAAVEEVLARMVLKWAIMS